MARRLATVLVAFLSVMISALVVSPAQADVVPPWCGDPVPDAAENLPDGTDPGDPPGSFPHIPYYAIRVHARGHRGVEPGTDEPRGDGPVGAGP